MKFEIIVLFVIMVMMNIFTSEIYRDEKKLVWHILRYVMLAVIPVVCLVCNIYQ